MIVFVILLLYYCIGCDNKEISNQNQIMNSCWLNSSNYLSNFLRVYSLYHNVMPTLQSNPLMTNWPRPAYNASKPMIIPMTSSA